jgi:hypothetical protein
LALLAGTAAFCSAVFTTLTGGFVEGSEPLIGLLGVFAVGADAFEVLFSRAGVLALFGSAFVIAGLLSADAPLVWAAGLAAGEALTEGGATLGAAAVLFVAISAAAIAGVATLGAALDFSGVFAGVGALVVSEAGFLTACVFDEAIAETLDADLLGALLAAVAVLTGGFLLDV